MAIVLAGLAGGTLATLAQLLLWLIAGEDAWALLERDARLTAALVLGGPALTGTAGVVETFLIAAAIHFGLSVAFAAVFVSLAARSRRFPRALAGAFLGAALYVVNLYGFTLLFPWFAVSRGGATLAAHVIFGAAVVLCHRWLESREA